ncbi:hypothetical protein [Leucobacter celer]|uniref:hypothetical protein n=1 Tax=Leucobacter celer TaxID=668625 RepID=UPI0006A7B77B|nr:hypothetical protein [Leucobacter celer]
MSPEGIKRVGRFELRASTAVARVVAAALTMLCAVLVSVALSAPAFAAEAPEAPARNALTTENAGGVEVQQEGARATVEVDADRVDADRVYAYVYAGDAEAVDVGWQELDAGVFDVDLSLMPAGEVVVAVLAGGGDLLGWGVAELSTSDSHAPATADSSAGGGFPWPVLLWVLVGAAAVLAVVVVLVLSRRRSGHSGAPAAAVAERPDA